MFSFGNGVSGVLETTLTLRRPLWAANHPESSGNRSRNATKAVLAQHSAKDPAQFKLCHTIN